MSRICVAIVSPSLPHLIRTLSPDLSMCKVDITIPFRLVFVLGGGSYMLYETCIIPRSKD